LVLIGDSINKSAASDSAGRIPPVQGYGLRRSSVLLLQEIAQVKEVESARRLVDGLSKALVEMESLGSLIAAAHVDAAIETLTKEFNIERNLSGTD
jgi:hypothetical protein